MKEQGDFSLAGVVNWPLGTQESVGGRATTLTMS